MKQAVMLVAVLAFARAAAGQNADDYRGGWRTDSGEAHTYEFSIRGATVRGIYCSYCADATTLAFVDGTLGPDGITFEVTGTFVGPLIYIAAVALLGALAYSVILGDIHRLDVQTDP